MDLRRKICIQYAINKEQQKLHPEFFRNHTGGDILEIYNWKTI